jgi:hypothetical protein
MGAPNNPLSPPIRATTRNGGFAWDLGSMGGMSRRVRLELLQHITARFTEGEIAEAMQPLRDRLVALEAENASLRAKLDSGPASRV